MQSHLSSDLLLVLSTAITTGNVDTHVRVVVRTHPKEGLLLRSLIYSLRAQGNSRPTMKVDFVLVPTELDSLSLAQNVQLGK